jgi:hypothetical protein
MAPSTAAYGAKTLEQGVLALLTQGYLRTERRVGPLVLPVWETVFWGILGMEPRVSNMLGKCQRRVFLHRTTILETAGWVLTPRSCWPERLSLSDGPSAQILQLSLSLLTQMGEGGPSCSPGLPKGPCNWPKKE